VPALLALYHHRPIVVVACFRLRDGRFGGHVGEPIWPLEGRSEKAEVLCLTEAMTKAMEVVIRAHPEQYFWMHNRWKTYS
jgi:KDO2-lipid IV(A) lauroyltransferase